MSNPASPVTLTLSVEGMSCAACTGRVERILKAQDGVSSAAANLALRQAQVQAAAGTDPQALAAAVTRAGFAAQPLAAPEIPDDDAAGSWRDAIIAGALTLPVFLFEMGGHLVPSLHHALHGLLDLRLIWGIEALLVTLVLAIPGRRFLTKGLPALVGGSPDMNSLVAVGTVAAWAYSMVVLLAPHWVPEDARVVYFEAAAVIVTLILIGRQLEARARGQAGVAISRLLRLQPKSARVVAADGSISDMPIDRLQPDMQVILRPGERVPVDAVVVEGRSLIDESMLTGEPLAVAKISGDKVTAGTINGNGSLTLKIEAVGADTFLARITALVAQAQGGKLPVQAMVDRVTAWFVPVVLGLAALTFAVWLALGQGVAQAVVAAVSVLIIACPCAMGLATPVSILVGSGRAAELGVLFRKGAAMQTLAEVEEIGFDKTGTLTQGRPQVVSVIGDTTLLPAVAAVERLAEHPLADAVLAYVQAQGASLPQASDFRAQSGIGAVADVAGRKIKLGAARMFAHIPDELQQAADLAASKGQALVFAGQNDTASLLITVADPVKPHAAAAIAGLQADGLRLRMLSGDTQKAAQTIGHGLGIQQVEAGLLPQDKLQLLQSSGQKTAFVGDGINDAPALAAAGVGIAMGTGTDIAIEAGDVVVISGDPLAVWDAYRISRATLANIRQNLLWAFGYNAALIPVAAGVLVPFGGPQLSPMLAAGAMALSSVFVLSNALRLNRFKGARA